MQALISRIIKLRVYIVIVFTLITLFAAWELQNIRINSDVTTYLPKDDPAVALFNEIGEEYSSNWTAVIILESENVFTQSNLEEIRDISSKIRTLEGIDYVVSLTSIMDIRSDEFGFEIGRLVDEYELPQTEEELKKLRTYTLSKDLYNGRIVSADGRYTLIICQIQAVADKNIVAAGIQKAVKELNPKQKLYFEGIPFQVLSIMEFIVNDLILLTPLIIIVILLILYAGFRSMKWVLLPIAGVGMGIIWTMALMSISGVALTPLSDALPVVLFAVGSAYGIHMVNKIRMAQQNNEDLPLAIQKISTGVILAGVTTFAGFLSFIFSSYLTIVRDFGIFAALGVLIILFISITFIPAVSSWFTAKKTTGPQKGSTFANGLLNYISVLVEKRRKALLIGAIVLIVISLAGIPLIERKVDILEYFKPSSSLRQSAKIMNTHFGGSIPVMVVVKGSVFDLETLNKLQKISEFLDSLPGVSNSRSVADYFMQMNEAMGEGRVLPDSPEKAKNLWFMLESEESMSQLVNYDLDKTLVQASMQNLDAATIHSINNQINEYIAGISETPGDIQATGMQAIYSKLDDSMFNNLMQSMLLAFLFVFVTMIFLIGSVKGAITGFSSLLFAMILVFGFMGFTGIALDIATILIAGITIGIGIDYSIHFTTAYRQFVTEGMEVSEAIRKTIQSTGRAIVINVLTIMLGFLVLLAANLIPLQQFGILISVSMLFAGISSLTLLPVLILVLKLKIKPLKHSKK